MKIFVAILLVAASRQLLGSDASQKQEKLMLEMASTVHKFAGAHALTDEQAWTLIGEMQIAGLCISKGGAGVIGQDTYVDVNGEKNTILFGSNRWEGKPSTETEVVLTDGHHVLSSIENTDPSILEIVIFSPKEVRYIDLSKNRGGRYLRAVK